MESAHAEMRAADDKQRAAREIIADTNLSNPDGTVAYQRASRDYGFALQRYSTALKVWVDYVLDS